MPRPITPPIAADIVIELGDGPDRPIVLIERRNTPHGWALPGGFMDEGETIEQAAVREAFEETGLEVELETLLGIYSRPDRDPRGHTVSVVFVARATGTPAGQDDALTAHPFGLRELPTPLAFDHDEILADYARYRATGEVPKPGRPTPNHDV